MVRGTRSICYWRICRIRAVKCPGFTELAVGAWAGEEAGRSCSPCRHVLQTSSVHSFAFAVCSACRAGGFLWKLLGSLWKRVRNSHFLQGNNLGSRGQECSYWEEHGQFESTNSQKPLWNIFFTLQSNSHLMCCHNMAVAVLFQHKVSSLFAVFEQSVHPSFSFSPNVSLFSYKVKLSNLKVSKCVDSSNTSNIYLSKITFLPIRLPRKGVWAEPDLV